MKNNLPVMLLKGFILLPSQEVRLELNNEVSQSVVSLATKDFESRLLVVCPKDIYEEEPDVSDLPRVGVTAKIKSRIELPNGNLRVVITGVDRVRVVEYSNNEKNIEMLMAKTAVLELPKYSEIEETALLRKLSSTLESYIKMTPYISDSILNVIRGINNLYRLTDMVTTFLPFNLEKKLEYVEEINAMRRARRLIEDLKIEMEVVKLDEKLEESLKVELDEHQKEFILREKITQIKKELGEESAREREVEKYFELIESLNLNDKTSDKILNEIRKFEYTNEMSPDSSLLRTYLDWVLNLPWNKKKTDVSDLKRVRKILDESHYGLEKVKTRMIEYIAIKNRNKNLKSPIVCLVGPPGVGKTSFAMGLAKALNKDFYKISVGGLNDASELLGHRRTYLGAVPGKIIQGLKKCGTKNPIFLIDEVDKMVKDYKGDPASALLDILDPEQNIMFCDNYIEEPFDLSEVLFVLTANDTRNIPSALYDRLEIIELSSYTEFEKVDIAKKYLLPNIYNEHVVKKNEIKFSDEIIKNVINFYTKEAGVRELSRKLSTIVRKIVTDAITNDLDIKVVLKKNDLETYLGQVQYDRLRDVLMNLPGLVRGLAYTPLGGSALPIESTYYEGKGNIKLTGLLGKSMEESIAVAYSYIKANKDRFKINDYYFNNRDIHIHALEGAIKKDGPSAGIAITTSLISLLKQVNVPSNVAMSGEITLCGDVLKIGGLKEKIIGGFNDGVIKFYIPKANLVDLEEIPNEVLSKIEVIGVNTYNEVYESLFNEC